MEKEALCKHPCSGQRGKLLPNANQTPHRFSGWAGENRAKGFRWRSVWMAICEFLQINLSGDIRPKDRPEKSQHSWGQSCEWVPDGGVSTACFKEGSESNSFWAEDLHLPPHNCSYLKYKFSDAVQWTPIFSLGWQRSTDATQARSMSQGGCFRPLFEGTETLTTTHCT